MRRTAALGMVSILLTMGCQVPAQAGGASPKPSASAPAALTVRLAFSKVHVAEAAEATTAEIVCKSEAELAAALKDRGLDKFPDGPETVAKALKSVDFTKETAILIDQGLQPSMTQTVEPIDATESAQGVKVRFTKRQSEIDLPALNRPYAILAIPKTAKPVTVEFIGVPTR